MTFLGTGQHYNREMNADERKTKDREFNDPLSEYLAWLMDSSIGIGSVSIGLDGIIGLIPGIGDVATGIVSALIIFRAWLHGVHRAAIFRMMLNVIFDTLLGSIPIVGDFFDFAFKSNIRNMQIYRESMRGTRNPNKDWAFIVGVVLVLIALMILPILGLVYIVRLMTR
jgi:hypothetical protein